MPLNLASPGIVVREVDLTQGRIDSSTNKTGGIVGEPKDSSDDDHPRFSRGVRSGQAGSGRLF